MMVGYHHEARAHAALTENKSSGQKCISVLEDLSQAIAAGAPGRRPFINWDYSKKTIQQQGQYPLSAYEHKINLLFERHAKEADGLILLLDEPEQSLDALAEANMWESVLGSEHAQVIAATHSIYPLMHADRFNLIEATPGYIDQVRTAYGLIDAPAPVAAP